MTDVETAANIIVSKYHFALTHYSHGSEEHKKTLEQKGEIIRTFAAFFRELYPGFDTTAFSAHCWRGDEF